jgi:amino acid transporter
MTWGFLVGSIFSFITALSLAEICSAYPQNGSVYIWSRKVSTEKYSKFLSFQVGWFYLFGSFAALSTNCLASASVLNSILKM